MDNYLFDDFAKDLLNTGFFKYYVDSCLADPEYDTDDPVGDLNEWIADDEHGGNDFLYESTPFVLAYKAGRDELESYLEHYYKTAVECYEYWEFEHSGFGSGYQCFDVFNSYVLALCSRYYASINKPEKAKKACFLLLCGLSYEGDPWEARYGEDGYDPEAYDPVKLYDAFESYFSSIKDMLSPDWQAVHPSITWNIGRYYLGKKDYLKAREFFTHGASIDYEGRQSIDPFIEVGKNQYELGLLYLKGLGVKTNPKKALKYFEMAAENAGEPTIPIIQDMRKERLLPCEVDPIVDVLHGYGDLNVHNLDKYVYYKELNEDQASTLKKTADFYLTQEHLLDFGTLGFLRDIYRYRLHDREKVEEINNLTDRLIESTPQEERTEGMDDYYVSRWKENWEKSVVRPSVNSGSIPKDPKPGDTFFYGTLANEPIEWKVLEVYDDGTFFIVTTKIILKMPHDGIFEWLNTDFIDNVFTEDEKKRIVSHDYRALRRYRPTYIYLPDRKQLEALEDLSQPVPQTALAMTMGRDNSFYVIDGTTVEPSGRGYRFIATYEVRGIRPAMDIRMTLTEEG